jgi:hypothetical protein
VRLTTSVNTKCVQPKRENRSGLHGSASGWSNAQHIADLHVNPIASQLARCHVPVLQAFKAVYKARSLHQVRNQVGRGSGLVVRIRGGLPGPSGPDPGTVVDVVNQLRIAVTVIDHVCIHHPNFKCCTNRPHTVGWLLSLPLGGAAVGARRSNFLPGLPRRSATHGLNPLKANKTLVSQRWLA